MTSRPRIVRGGRDSAYDISSKGNRKHHPPDQEPSGCQPRAGPRGTGADSGQGASTAEIR
jgi:hypothetical protein